MYICCYERFLQSWNEILKVWALIVENHSVCIHVFYFHAWKQEVLKEESLIASQKWAFLSSQSIAKKESDFLFKSILILGWFFYVFTDKKRGKVDFLYIAVSETKKLLNTKVRKIKVLTLRSTFLGDQNRLGLAVMFILVFIIRYIYPRILS